MKKLDGKGETIRTIIDTSRSKPFYGISEEMEFFKGSHAIPSDFGDMFRFAKRQIKWQMR